jgi:hypothetical protein
LGPRRRPCEWAMAGTAPGPHVGSRRDAPLLWTKTRRSYSRLDECGYIFLGIFLSYCGGGEISRGRFGLSTFSTIRATLDAIGGFKRRSQKQGVIGRASDKHKMDKVDFLPGHPLSYTTTKMRVLRNDIELSTATGFVLKLGQKFVLVTNWHVLSGYNPASGRCLSNTGALPNRIECHVTVSRKLKERGHTGEELYFKPLSIDLFAHENPIWLDDKKGDSQNDYAIIDLANYVPELKEKGVSLRSILGGHITLRRGYSPTRNGLFHKDDLRNIYPSVGAEVFVLGYPRGIANSGIFPIWKRASVASEPQGSVTLGASEYNNVFYIDALTKSGMSGSPVVCLAKPGDHFHSEDGVTVKIKKAESLIVGVYAGRGGVTQEEYELSVGRVWKIGAVERILMQNERL